jgi:ABC-type glutathione transport system ATPase component
VLPKALSKRKRIIPHKHSQLQVHYKDLTYEVTVPLESRDIPSVASEVVNCATGCARTVTCQTSPGQPFRVLDSVDGALRPGTMTLVLAPPGHGKSALLQTVAGVISQAQTEGTVSSQCRGMTLLSQSIAAFHAQVMYSDAKMQDLGASLSKLVAYMDQVRLASPCIVIRPASKCCCPSLCPEAAATTSRLLAYRLTSTCHC